MIGTPGVEGYERAPQRFIELSQALEFSEVCRDFLGSLPDSPARILDAGSGAGQNAAALARMGHSVVAVEPMPDFRAASRATYSNSGVLWLDDSLPSLHSLSELDGTFEFILVDGVWHHLREQERQSALARFCELLVVGGRCAISLRNGPPGLGTVVYPTDARDTISVAESHGFESLVLIENQPSIMPGKDGVTWSRVVLQKRS